MSNFSRKSKSTNVLAVAGIAVAVILVVVLGFVGCQAYYAEDTHRDCIVTDKDRTTVNTDSGSESQTRVYTENCGTFTVADTLIKGNLNSADTFGSIQAGKTYDFTTIGFRSGLLSQFPNIIEVEEK